MRLRSLVLPDATEDPDLILLVMLLARTSPVLRGLVDAARPVPYPVELVLAVADGSQFTDCHRLVNCLGPRGRATLYASAPLIESSHGLAQAPLGGDRCYWLSSGAGRARRDR